MANSWGILGQTADASTETPVYTVPASRICKYYVSVTNRSTAGTFRLAHVVGGGATGNDDYFAYDEAIDANQSLTSEIRTGNATDVVKAETSSANITVQVYGVEADQPT